MSDLLSRLHQVLNERKSAEPNTSYVAGLYSKGENAILKKIGEEATELVMAAKDQNKQQIIHETADLWFHTLVLLCSHDLQPEHVLAELERRFGMSGLDEKAARGS